MFNPSELDFQTKNERKQLIKDPQNYKVFIVTNVTGHNPQIKEFKNFSEDLVAEKIRAEPIRWRIY